MNQPCHLRQNQSLDIDIDWGNPYIYGTNLVSLPTLTWQEHQLQNPKSPNVQPFYDRLWSRKSPQADSTTSPNLRKQLALQWLKPGESYLDIGCGTGELCREASKLFPNIHGCDIAEQALFRSQEQGIQCTKLDLNREHLPYRTQSFDAVTALDIIEHLFDPLSFLKDIHRILKPSGQLILSTPNFRKLKNIHTLWIKGHFPKTSDDPEGWDGGHVAYFTRKDIYTLLHQTGFSSVRSQGIYSHQRYRIAKRVFITILGQRFSQEFLAAGIMVEACLQSV
jgi:2-polyprenyl-3-methyl-5-hydroxy-6-metoxy-1,4-benzoquinol methylase